MRWFNNLRIRNKILVSSFSFIVIILVISIQGFFALTTANSNFDTFYKDRFLPVKDLSKMFENILQMRINMMQEVVHFNRGEIKEMNDRFDYSERLVEENDKLWKAYMATKLTEKEKILADKFYEYELANSENRKQFGKELKAGNVEKALEWSDKWLQGYGPMREAMLDLIQLQVDVGEQLQATQETTSTFAISMMVGLSVGAVILGVGITFILNRAVATPLNNAATRVRDIAEGEGDLTQALDVNSKDEVGELAESLNLFIRKIHDIVVDISDNTRKVVDSSNTLNESSQSLSSGTEEMSTQAESIATAATQMSQNFEAVSSSIEEMSISIDEVAKQSAEASRSAGAAKKTSESANTVIQELGVSAGEIGKVIESIVSIADQTNLLALNASIEAAGAGEAGRGFAVVASEVKELARQAGESSEDIKDRVTAVQGNTDTAVKAIGDIDEVIAKVNEINSSIASSVEEQSITAKEIANNISQASSAANDVTKNIEGITVAAREGAQNAENLAKLSTDLNRLSDTLSEIVGQFKIHEKKLSTKAGGGDAA